MKLTFFWIKKRNFQFNFHYSTRFLFGFIIQNNFHKTQIPPNFKYCFGIIHNETPISNFRAEHLKFETYDH